ncbi:hypothetical protein F2Q68_00011457 [Brassica cretica]|uniref:Uncharacterized protein n=1 Tax=Brassica cretica TaxID=69181 RepID=A0A8S9KW27_BRACR|nr:hypothetical protein F2Q68_00011457 [Brassica cretica]
MEPKRTVKITRNKAYIVLPKTELSWKQVMESLHIACRVGDLELLSTLISTAAQLAEDNWRFVTISYKKRAIIDVLDKKGQTPLMHAVKSKEPKVVKMLVSAEDASKC